MSTKYHISMCARVRDLCYLGATNTEIARLFGVSVGKLLEWKIEYPEFGAAWNDGAHHADARVAAALFKRACGFTYEVEKETKDGVFTETKYAPPDTAACIFWLTNRRPNNWQNKVDHTNIIKEEGAGAGISELEAARRIAYALSLGAQTLLDSQQGKVIDHDNQNSATRKAEQS